MRPFCKIIAIAALLVAATVAYAAPPTATPSPGYDARLQEQRAAAAAKAMPPAQVAPRHHNKPKAH
jgi:hypothetical protein